MACNKVQIPLLNLDIAAMVAVAEGGKDLKFNYLQVTKDQSGMDTFRDLFSSDKTVRESAVDKMKKIVGNRSDVKKKLGLLFDNSTVEGSIKSILTKNNPDSQELIANVLTMTAVLESLETEEALITKYNVSEEAVDEKNQGADKGTHSTSLDRVLQTLGKELLESQGVFLKGGNLKNAYAYKSVAQKEVDRMVEEGYFQINTNGKWIAGDMKNPNSERLRTANSPLVSGPTISLNTKTVKDAESLFRTVKQAKRLVSAYTDLAPKNEATTEIVKQREAVGHGVADTMLKLYQGEFAINDDVKGVFDYLNKLYRDSKYDSVSFNNALRKHFGVNSQEEFLSQALGLNLHNHSIFQVNNQGMEQSRVGPLIGLLEHYESMDKDKFFYTYFMASNVRLFQNESVLNVQSDSKMARHIVQGSKEVIYEGKELTEFVSRLAADSGLHTDIITGKAFEEGYKGPVKVTPTLRKFVKTINAIRNKTGASAQKESIALLQALAREGNDGYFGKGVVKPFEQFKFLSAVADVQSATDGKMVSKHLAESDATASGPFLKLLQNMYIPAVRQLVERLGIQGVDFEGDPLKDVYAIVQEKLISIDATDEGTFGTEDIAKQMTMLEDYMEMLSDLVPTMRELVKLPVTTFFYEQQDENNAKNIGKEHAQFIIEQGHEKVNEAIKLLGLKIEPVKRMRDLTEVQERELYNALTNGIVENVATFLVEQVATTFGEGVLQESKTELSAIQKNIAKLPPVLNDKGNPIDDGIGVKLMNPAHYLNWVLDPANKGKKFNLEEHKEHRRTMDKRFETQITQEGETALATLNHDNPNSIHVLSIHMMDAAILIRTVEKVYAELREIHGNAFKDAELDAIVNSTPIQLVHDAITLPPKYSAIAEKHYEQEIMNATYHYNVMEQALMEYDFRIANATKHDKNFAEDPTVKAEMDKLREKNGEDVKEIRSYIDSKRIDGKYAVVEGSFATDISEEATAASDEKAIERMGKITPKETPPTKPTGKKKVRKKFSDKMTEESQAVIDAVESGDYVVADTETTGTAEYDVMHEVAYTINGETKVIHLPLEGESSDLDGDFYQFYGKYNKAADGSDITSNEEAFRAINDKANTDAEVTAFAKQMKADVKGKPVLFHNSKFDTDMMDKHLEFQEILSDSTVVDSMELATTLKADALNEAQENEGTTKGMRTQETLMSEYGIETDAAHTAEGDIKALDQLVQAMVKQATSLGNSKMNNGKVTGDVTIEDMINTAEQSDVSPEHKDMLTKIKEFIAANTGVTFTPSNSSNYIAKDGSETIEVAEGMDPQMFIEEFSHEIDHANTFGYIVNNKDSNEIKYMTKGMDSLLKTIDDMPLEIADVANRLGYVKDTLNSRGIEGAIAELVAILNSEPEIAEKLYKHLGGVNKQTMAKRLKSLVNKVAEFLTGSSLTWDEMKGIEADKLFNSVAVAVAQGTAERKADGPNTVNTALGAKPKMESRSYTPQTPDKDIESDMITEAVSYGNQYLADLIAAGTFAGTPLLKNGYDAVNEWADKYVPMYKYTTDIMSDAWSTNAAVKRIRNYVKPNTKLYPTMNKLRSAFSEARQNMLTRMSSEGAKLDKLLKEAYTSKEDIAKANAVFASSGLHSVAKSGMLQKIAAGNQSLEAAISELEAQVGNNAKHALTLSKVYTRQDLTGLNARNNVEAYGISPAHRDAVESLASLYSLAHIEGSVDMLQNVYKNHKELYTSLVSLSAAVDSMDRKIHNTIHSNGAKDINVGRGNQVADLFEKNYTFKAVTTRQLNSKEFQDNGWTVLRNPEKEALGIVYKESSGEIQEGAGMNTSYIKTGVTIPAKMHKSYGNNVMTTKMGADNETKSLQFTPAEMKTLGAISDPIKSLIRAYAHKELIAETQKIREVVAEGMTNKYTKQSALETEVEKLIETDDHPVFIEIPDDMSYNKLSKKVRGEYEIADSSILTDIGGFKQGVKLVRKDVSSEMVGFREINPFAGNSTANKIFRLVKDVVRLSKINAIILNPGKITMDFVSSMAVATAKGASLQEMWKYSREAAKYSKEISDLRNKRLSIQFDISVHGKTDKLVRDLAATDKALEEHPFSPALAHGFIQSMGTELLSKDHDSIQGLEASMQNMIEKLTKTNKGELTKFNNIVKQAANMGGKMFQVEALYAELGDRLSKYEGTKQAGDVLNSMSKEILAIKSDEDMTQYLSELFATPGSQLVRLGGAMTLYADMLPRWIIYRHNVNKGMDEEAAALDALDSLLDYKVQMPPELKFLSDLYLMPFPSFFLRIQRVLLTMVTKDPLSLGTQLSMNAIIGNNGQNIAGSNIFHKWEADTIFSNPNDIIKSGGNLIPYGNFFGFL